MKWIELNGKIDPPFNTKMVIANFKTKEWCEGTLDEITSTAGGKQYNFIIDTEGHGWNEATHYMLIKLPEPPKPKEQ